MNKKDDLTLYLRAIDKTKKAFSSVLKGLSRIAKGAAAVGAAFTALSAGLFAVFKANAPYIDALGKTADKLGVATEELQAFRDAADFAGISQSSLDTSLQRFIRRLGEAAKGTGATAKEFERLGLDAKKLASEGPGEAFKEILKQIQAVESQTERVRLAFAFFGKEGVDLVRLTSSAIEQSKEQMDELGLSISRLEAFKVEQANDALKRLGDITAGVGRRITANVAGAMTVLTNRVIEASASFIGFSDDSRLSSENILRAVGWIIDQFNVLVTFIDVTRIAFNGLSIAALEFSKTLTGLVDNKLLPAMAKLPGPPGRFADELVKAGGVTEKVQSKIESLGASSARLQDAINERSSDPSWAEVFLDDLRDVENQAQSYVDAVQTMQNAGLDFIDDPLGQSGLASDDNGSDGQPGSQEAQTLGDAPSAFGANQPGANAADAADLAAEKLKEACGGLEATDEKANKLTNDLGLLGNAFGNFAEVAESKNARAFKAFKTLEIGLTTIAAISTAIKAANETTGGPIARLAAYAAVAAKMFAAVRAIKSVNFGGGSTSPPSGGGGVTATAESSSFNPSNQGVSAGERRETQGDIVVNVRGGGFGEEMLQELVDQLNRRGLSRELVVR